MVAWETGDSITQPFIDSMKIKNHKEYMAAYERAALMMDIGFEGNLEKERYFREIIQAIMEYEKNTPPPPNLPLNDQTIGLRI